MVETIEKPTVSVDSFQVAKSADFREALSEVPTPVFLVATDGCAGKAGLTVSSVTSVSADPPTMLVCINENSSSLNAIRSNRRFSINLLASGQADLAARFAGMSGERNEDRFTFGKWVPFTSGCHFLDTAIFSLDCRLTKVRTEATHVLLFGEVQEIRCADAASETLVYHRRAFRLA